MQARHSLLKGRLGWRSALVGLAFAITVPVAESGAAPFDAPDLSAAQIRSACAAFATLALNFSADRSH